MTPLAILICLGGAIAQGAGPSAEDRRVLAEIGLKSVGRDLVQVGSGDAPRARRPGIRQDGPACHWFLVGMADWLPYGGLPLTPMMDGFGLSDTALTNAGLGYGGFDGARDYAALVPVLGGLLAPVGDAAGVLPIQPVGPSVVPDAITPLPPTLTQAGEHVPVPEPASVVLFVTFVALLALSGCRARDSADG